jgi:2'-5' RNA ligase
MPRLFVAIELPDEVKRRLAALQTDIPGARWVKPDAMHLTLKFIGDQVPETQIRSIRAALAGIEQARFTLAVRGVGRFPPGMKQAPRVLWAGIVDQPALKQLQSAVARALEPLGFEPERRGFNPHITLARVQGDRAGLGAAALLERERGFDGGAFEVRHFALIRSDLLPAGPRYMHIGTFALFTGEET